MLFHKDEVAIKGYIKLLENLDTHFKGYYCSVIDLIKEDEGVLLEEQAKLDDHEDKVTELMSRRHDLRVEEKKVTAPFVANPSKPFEKWLGSLDSELLMEKWLHSFVVLNSIYVSHSTWLSALANSSQSW